VKKRFGFEQFQLFAPVFTDEGKLIGIISFKTSTSLSTKAELSFIIPIDEYISVMS